MESAPRCQFRMRDGLPAKWTPPCQGAFTSCRCPLICLMTNDHPVKNHAGRHGVPQVCVCGQEAGSPLSLRHPLLLALLSCCDRSQRWGRRRREGVWGDKGDSERTERKVRLGASGCSVTHKLWQGHFTWRRYTLSDLSEWTILVTLFWSASKSKVDLNWLCRVGRCNLSPQCTLGPAICHTKPWHSLFYLHFKSDSTMNQTVIVSFMMTAKSFFSSSASKQTRRQIVGP